MSELSNRLVQAAIDAAVNAPHDEYDVPDYDEVGRAAAVAVLRALDHEYGESVVYGDPIDLIDLADEVEKDGPVGEGLL